MTRPRHSKASNSAAISLLVSAPPRSTRIATPASDHPGPSRLGFLHAGAQPTPRSPPDYASCTPSPTIWRTMSAAPRQFPASARQSQYRQAPTLQAPSTPHTPAPSAPPSARRGPHGRCARAQEGGPAPQCLHRGRRRRGMRRHRQTGRRSAPPAPRAASTGARTSSSVFWPGWDFPRALTASTALGKAVAHSASGASPCRAQEERAKKRAGGAPHFHNKLRANRLQRFRQRFVRDRSRSASTSSKPRRMLTP